MQRSGQMSAMMAGPANIKRAIRVEMVRRGMRYADLRDRLQKMHGIDTTVENLRNRVAMGKISAVLFCQIMDALGVKSIAVSDLMDVPA